MPNRKRVSTACLLAAAWALPLSLACTVPARAGSLPRQATDAPSTSTRNATNLGTMVVNPQGQQKASSSGASKIRIQRPDLHFNLHPGSGAARPQSGQTPQPREPQTSRPPTPLHIVQPRYPQNALAQGEKGSVTVAFTIGADGATSQVHVIDSQPPRVFDAAALAAVRRWRFNPATRDGNPVAVKVNQTLVFRPPHEKPATHRAEPKAPSAPRSPGASAPAGKLVPLHIVAPRYPRRAYYSSKSGSVTVKFTVDRNGRTSNVRVIRADPPRLFNRAAVSAVQKWRFKPLRAPQQVVKTIRFSPPH